MLRGLSGIIFILLLSLSLGFLFYALYGLTPEKMRYANPNAIVMHPGPINRGVEIASEVADGVQSMILHQVNYGIAVRMAVLAMTMQGQLTTRGEG